MISNLLLLSFMYLYSYSSNSNSVCFHFRLYFCFQPVVHKLLKTTKIVTSGIRAALSSAMADGTRLKSLDERLGVLEGKIAEFTTEFGKEKG